MHFPGQCLLCGRCLDLVFAWTNFWYKISQGNRKRPFLIENSAVSTRVLLRLLGNAVCDDVEAVFARESGSRKGGFLLSSVRTARPPRPLRRGGARREVLGQCPPRGGGLNRSCCQRGSCSAHRRRGGASPARGTRCGISGEGSTRIGTAAEPALAEQSSPTRFCLHPRRRLAPAAVPANSPSAPGTFTLSGCPRAALVRGAGC